MVINNLHVSRPERAVRPLKTKPPLIIDADAVLALAIADQRLKTVARQRGQVFQPASRFQPVELQTGGAFNS